MRIIFYGARHAHNTTLGDGDGSGVLGHRESSNVSRGRFILVKGGKPVAELRPLPASRRLGELEAVLRSLPALSAAEAEDFAADIAKELDR